MTAQPTTVAPSAASLGYDAVVNDPDIRRVRWSDLMRSGVVARVSIGRWRPYVTLQPADLGLPELDDERAKKLAKLMPLGQKCLITPEWEEKLATAERAGRANLGRMSYAILNDYTRFVPMTAYAAWKESNAACEVAFYAARDAMLDDWANIEEQLRIEYSIAADRAFDQVSRMPAEALAQLPEEVRALATDRRAFGVNYVERILSLRPSVEKVKAAFRYDVELELLEPGAAFTGDEALLKDAAMEADLRAAMGRRREKLTDGFVESVIGQMQGVMVDMAEGVLNGIEKTGKVGPSGGRILNIVAERAPALNFYGDEDQTVILARVKEIAAQDSKDRNPEEIAAIMRAIATIGRKQLASVGRKPATSGVKLGVPDSPDDQDVRRARKALGLIDEAEEVVPTAKRRPRKEAVAVMAEAQVAQAAEAPAEYEALTAPRRRRRATATADESGVEAVA